VANKEENRKDAELNKRITCYWEC